MGTGFDKGEDDEMEGEFELSERCQQWLFFAERSP